MKFQFYIGGVSPLQSCRLPFDTFRILTLRGIFILETLTVIYKTKITLKCNKHVHTYNTRNKQECHISVYHAMHYKAIRSTSKVWFYVKNNNSNKK